MPQGFGRSPIRLGPSGLVWGCALVVGFISSGCQFSRLSTVRSNAESSRQWSQQAAAAMENGHWAQAEELLREAVRTNPDDPVARGRLARALLQRNERQAAITQIEAARQLAPHDAELGLQAAELYLQVGDYENARRATEQIIDREPRSAYAWIRRGQAWQMANDPKRALADYQRGLQYAPNDRFALQQISVLYRTLHQPQRSLSSLQALAATYPPREEPPELFYGQGLAYQELGRHEDAAERLRLAAERGAPNPDVLAALGVSELQAGHPDRAHEAAQRALALAPNHVEARQLVERVVSVAPVADSVRR